MDFMTSGAAGLGGSFENWGSTLNSSARGLQEGADRMSRFSEVPNPNVPADHNSPTLVISPPPPAKRGSVWAQRVGLVVLVLFCLEVGIILLWCPWTKIWSENSILVSYPRVREFLLLGFVRGAISGLGLVNIWMGIAEAVRYRESHN